MKKIAFLVLFISITGYSVQEYYSLSRSIRSMGMGGAFYGLSNDEYALFYNPAGLSLYNSESEGMLRVNTQMAPKTLSAFNTITKSGSKTVDVFTPYQGTPIYGQVGLLPYYVRKHFAIALLLADTKFDFAMLGKEIDTSVDVTAITDSGLVIGYARSIVDPNLHIGLNSKLLFRAGGRKRFELLDIAQKQALNLNPKDIGGAGGGIDFDLGATYELQNLPWGLQNRVSLVFNNLIASDFSMARVGGKPPGLTRMVSLGYYTVFPGWNFVDNFHVLFDLAEFNLGGESDRDYGARVGSFFKHINFGVEMPINWFTLRAGFHQGYLSAGLGVNAKFFRLDFATYGEELAGGPGRLESRRIALTLAFGFGSAPPAPYSGLKEIPLNQEEPKPEAPKDVTPKVEAPKVETPKTDAPKEEIKTKPE